MFDLTFKDEKALLVGLGFSDGNLVHVQQVVINHQAHEDIRPIDAAGDGDVVAKNRQQRQHREECYKDATNCFHNKINAGFLKLLFIRQDHLFGDKPRGIAAVLVDVAHHARADSYQLAFGEEEHGLQLGMKSFVGMADHVLILEVGAASETTDNEPSAHFLAEVGGESVVALHDDVRIVGENGFAPFDAILQGEGATFLHVDAHGHIDEIKHGQGAQHDGAVAKGDGIE